jgi:hypothetical protein
MLASELCVPAATGDQQVDGDQNRHVDAQRPEHARSCPRRHRQDQREHAERTGEQHPVDDHHHRVGHTMRERDHRLPARWRQPRECEGEAERKHHQRRDRPLGRRRHHVHWHQRGDPVEARRRRWGGGCGISRLDRGHEVAAPRAGGE